MGMDCLHGMLRSFTSSVSSRAYFVGVLWMQRRVVHSPLPGGLQMSYEDTIKCLNSLQSNLSIRKLGKERLSDRQKSVGDTVDCLQEIGISLMDLNRLNAIHVAGTKGKGSCCAFVESILRKHGYRTGFFSSPHLLSVRERIRINGLPLSEDKFIDYFWDVYRMLEQIRPDKMPFYFKFLTVLGYYVFLNENVDVAVIETGLGGLYDSTNVLLKPVVVGITTIDYDHTEILGDTLMEIALQKAGIMKPNVPVVTMAQEDTVIKVLKENAAKLDCEFLRTDCFDFANVKLGIPGDVQFLNAQLALNLCRIWLNKKDNLKNFAHKKSLNDQEKLGLMQCSWPGRFQVIVKKHIVYCLDGAHTEKSMQYCREWFEDLFENGTGCIPMLVFGAKPEKAVFKMLDVLSTVPFKYAFFTPTSKLTGVDGRPDLVDTNKSLSGALGECQQNYLYWQKRSNKGCRSMVVPDLESFLQAADKSDFQSPFAQNETGKIPYLLVTGSIHLIGQTLSILNVDILKNN